MYHCANHPEPFPFVYWKNWVILGLILGSLDSLGHVGCEEVTQYLRYQTAPFHPVYFIGNGQQLQDHVMYETLAFSKIFHIGLWLPPHPTSAKIIANCYLLQICRFLTPYKLQPRYGD